MAARVGSSELLLFATAIIQAMEAGGGLLPVVSAQARLLRGERRRYLESSARQAPVRMLVPMAVFILPVLMLVVLGPPFLRLMGIANVSGP
jgi:tight adherence protein C